MFGSFCSTDAAPSTSDVALPVSDTESEAEGEPGAQLLARLGGGEGDASVAATSGGWITPIIFLTRFKPS